MNKTIVGELQNLIALAEQAQSAEEFEELEDLVVMMSDHWHKLHDSIDRTRPEGANWLVRQMNSSSFRTKIAHLSYRPVVTR